MPTSAYRTLLVLNTTSDWTTVLFRSGAQIGGARLEVIEGQNAPGFFTRVELPENITVGKTQYDPTKVAVKASIVLVDLTVGGQVVVEIGKGCMGYTNLQVYNYNGYTPEYIDTFTAGPGDCDFPGLTFPVSADSLTQGGPLSIQPSGEFGRLVWAFYYPWYHVDEWYRTTRPIIIDRPLIGPYDSSNPAVIEKHIQMAKSAGIDGFIVSWWGKGEYTDLNLPTILDIAGRNAFKVSIYFESLLNSNPRPKDQLEQMFRDFFHSYGNDPRYFRIDGLPVIFVYAVSTQPVEVWREVISKMEAEGHRGFYIADSLDPQYLDVFQGIHTYFPPPEDDLNQLYDDVGQLYRGLSLASRTHSLLYPEQNKPVLWAATIFPGVDTRELDYPQPLYYPRDDGKIYNSTFRAAMDSDPDWILITSFNEWWENTHIEPSEMYGHQYLDFTAQYSAEFKGLTPGYAARINGVVVVPDPSDIGQGSKIIFNVTVQNTGTNDISSAKVQVKIWRPDGGLASSPYKYVYTFKTGTERTVQITYTLSSSAPLGAWAYDVYVYRSSMLLDQVADQGFTVRPAVKTGEILSVTADPDPVGQGGATAFTVVFKNTGNVIWSTARLTAKIHKPASTTVYATRSLTVSKIVPNVEYSYQVKWKSSSSAALGTYTYDVHLTYRSTVLDSRAGNTVKVAPIVKTGEIASVTDAPDPITRPGTATFTVVVKNTGNTIWSSGRVTIKIYKPGGSTPYTAKTLSLSNIVPGVEYAYNLKWTVSSYATTGTYRYDVYFYYGTSTLISSDVGNPSNTITIN